MAATGLGAFDAVGSVDMEVYSAGGIAIGIAAMFSEGLGRV